MKIKLTCRKVAIKFTILFCATFLSMWICCAVMALGGDIQGRNLFVIVSAFCILSLYHIISCYHQTLTLSEYEIILKRGLETWRIRYEEVGRIIFTLRCQYLLSISRIFSFARPKQQSISGKIGLMTRKFFSEPWTPYINELRRCMSLKMVKESM